jgi:small subunit ribosomal protein S4
MKGEQCATRCALERRTTTQTGRRPVRRKVSAFGLQLREKQKLRLVFGVLEAQFRRYFREAASTKGVTGENLLRLLEMRLDNIVFRLGFASSRPQARQLVNHGHFQVNGKKVGIPSYQCKAGDVVTVRTASRALPPIVAALQHAGSRRTPDWLQVQAEELSGRIICPPRRDQMEVDVNEQLIVEFYSR